MNQPEVSIVEVGPRDGLQNEQKILSTEQKAEFIGLLLAAGLSNIEVTSFVAPNAVPQLADADQLLKLLPANALEKFSALVPNLKGLERAKVTGIKEIAIFAAASETFSQKNINKTIAQSMLEYTAVIEAALAANLKVRAYISCAFGCAYEGNIASAKVVQMAEEFYRLGCYQISVADTIGVASIKQVQNLLSEISASIPLKNIALHMHNTYGQALVSAYAALEAGVRTFDAAVSGLGGCPFSPNSVGNLATEELVYMLNGLGLSTNIDLDKLLLAGSFISTALHKQPASNLARAKIIY